MTKGEAGDKIKAGDAIQVNNFKLFLTDFTDDEIRHCVNSAYSDKNFATENIAEISHLLTGTYILELWHGPTCAFKDMALQILPYLLTTSAKKTIDGKEIAILVATSGDTGKAALEGFKDVDGTSITVFYPEDGVSDMQKMQMATQMGENVNVTAIRGNFDDAQSGVKRIFSDADAVSFLDGKGHFFSSANSINWGRLVPQIVYYFSAYADMIASGDVKCGEKINVCVIKEKLRSTEIFLIMICDILNNIKFECNSNIDIS